METPQPVDLDIEEIPFSYQGSWLDVSPVVGLRTYSDDLHVVSHQTGMHAVLTLVPREPVTWRRSDVERDMGPSRLKLIGPGGYLDVCFADSSTLRARGVGLGLSVTATCRVLSACTGTYMFIDPLDGATVFTSYETGRRYRVTRLGGQVDVTGAEELGECTRTVDVGRDGEEWEIAIEEFETARRPYAAPTSFDITEERARAAFSAYAHGLVPWVDPLPNALSRAAYVLWSATVEPRGFVQRESILMSKHWMDKVWSWDHCFNTLALARSNPRSALDQFLLPFDYQDSSGALPDSVTHSEVRYNFTKPPVHGWVLRKLRETFGADLWREQLPDIYDKLSSLTRFWLEYRVARQGRLPYYEHGNDSGWDNATTFDRRRVVEAPDLAAFLVVQLDVLARIALELDRHAERATWEDARNALSSALVEDLWRGSSFIARSPEGGEESSTTSLLGAVPLLAAEWLAPPIVKALAEKVSAHLTVWGLSTEPPESAEYEADGYWRGPIWAPTTVLIEDGLRRAGYEELANEISLGFRRLCEASGFAENFDATTGRGLRDLAYTWTASCYIHLSAEHVARTVGHSVGPLDGYR